MTSKGSLPQEVEVFNLLLHSLRFYRKIFVVDFFENVSWPHDPSDDDIVDVCCNL